MVQKTISVIGCGWLGFPLAQTLVKQGFAVKGSTTTSAKVEVLRASGIEPFLVSFPENISKSDLLNLLSCDVLVLNLPPKRTEPEASAYETTIQQLLSSLPNPATKIIFVSSTSVYPDLNREVWEQDAQATAEATSLLLRCEHWVQSNRPQQATIVRFGGLMGGTRHPGKFLAGRQNIPQPEGPVNMIHLQDCLGLLTGIITQDKWGYTFNACAPSHPTRRQFYTLAAQQLGLTPPQFLEEPLSQFKIINSQSIQKELNYTFLFPDLLACLTSSQF